MGWALDHHLRQWEKPLDVRKYFVLNLVRHRCVRETVWDSPADSHSTPGLPVNPSPKV